ncbi:MAG: oligosaccharide flippase family protein [Alphaproteobacteria bacterium]|nr:oligosaccharide flippase family protein [Alphaproteobacteria bacterium]
MLKSVAAMLPPMFVGPLARSAATTMAYRLINVAIGLAITTILAKSLGADGFGIVALGLSIAFMLSMGAKLGLDIYFIRMAPQYIETHKWALLNGLLYFSAVLVLILAVSASALAAMLATAVRADSAIIIACAIAPLVALNFIAHGILRSIMQISKAYMPEFIFVQIVVLTGALILASRGALSPGTALLAYLTGWSLAAAVSWFWVFKHWPQAARGAARQFNWRAWLGASMLVMVAGLGEFIIGKLEILTLSAYGSPQALGHYAIALKFALFATFPVFALSSGFAPTIARLHATADRAAMVRKIILGARMTLIGATLAAIAISVGVTVIFPWLGAEFAAATPLVFILCGGFVAQASVGRPLDVLLMIGAARQAAIGSVISTLFLVLIMMTLIPPYGALGAAISTAVSFAFHSALLAYFVWKKIGLRCDIFAAANAA